VSPSYKKLLAKKQIKGTRKISFGAPSAGLAIMQKMNNPIPQIINFSRLFMTSSLWVNFDKIPPI
jgi:hypothetical protein